MSALFSLRNWLFQVRNIDLPKRSSPDHSLTAQQLGAACNTFVFGYRVALEYGLSRELDLKLAATPNSVAGFAFEGAAMALAIQDWLTPWNRNRVLGFLAGSGSAHPYVIHVGTGWTLARLPHKIETFLSRFDPLLRWLLIDGYGFHEGFFRLRKYPAALGQPRRLNGYARRAFDQGLGRSLWFTEAGSIKNIVRRIRAFEPHRHGDLWSGVGLASVYAGEVAESDLESLRESCGGFLPQLAQGAAFGAKARQRAGNILPYQRAACAIICEMDATDAAEVTDEQLANLSSDELNPAYEIWRTRIQQHFRHHLKVRV